MLDYRHPVAEFLLQDAIGFDALHRNPEYWLLLIYIEIVGFFCLATIKEWRIPPAFFIVLPLLLPLIVHFYPLDLVYYTRAYKSAVLFAFCLGITFYSYFPGIGHMPPIESQKYK